jgi:branched-chain amino acid transport system substrate-binding protein
VSQGTGSNHALNIIQQLKKHNKRNPDQSVVYLNHSAVTTAFTEDPLCTFYHFRFDANVSMKVAALTTAMGMDDNVRKVYLINQNYAYGQAFQEDANKLLPERAPNTEIVGDELIVPFGKIQDFTPYIAKIKASGADTVLTGNWGPDLHRMVTAGVDAGLDVQWFTIYGYLNSTLPVFGKQVIGKLKATFENNINDDGPEWITELAADYQQKYDGKSWVAHRIYQTVEALGKAIKKAGTDNPEQVALALEGIQLEGQYGTVIMRKKDHQMQMPLAVGTVTDDFKLEQDKSGVAFKTDFVIPVTETTLQTTCEMDDRPD